MQKDHLPKISVITPSYNSGEHIRRAIESVREQDYVNWEHIVVDGGSTDGTKDILADYPHLIWKSEKDNGQADAMNKGFAMATGDAIVYLNADDYFFPGAFSAVAPLLERGEKFVVGDVMVKSPRLGSDFLNVPEVTLAKMLRHWEPDSFCHNPVGYFYAREVQEKCPYNPDNYATMDLEFLLDAAVLYPFAKVNATLGCFEDGRETKTGVTQAKLDYWQPATFPYLQKHVDRMEPSERIAYERDRREGYATMQSRLNRLNRGGLPSLPVEKLPSVSVVIPSYNCAPYVARAVDSVLTQGIPDIQVIVVDDASTDDTQNVLAERYASNPSVSVIRHEKNRMLGAARNTGMDAATGKYLFFLDADDWLEPGALALLASVAETYGSEITAGGAQKAWDSGRTEPYHAFALSCPGGREALWQFADYRIGSIAWNKLYLLPFVRESGVRFIEPYWYEDVNFTMPLIAKCRKYLSVEDVCVNYFQRDDSYNYSKPTLLNLRSNVNMYVAMTRFVESEGLLSDFEGKELARRLFTAHCSNDIFPKMRRYAESRTREEFEAECRAVCEEMLGPAGFAVADYLVRAAAESSSPIAAIAAMVAPRMSPKDFARRVYARAIPARFKPAAKRFYLRYLS